MLPILATFVILLVFGIGDMVATKTKAIVSMLFLSSVIFLAGFWTKVLPTPCSTTPRCCSSPACS